MEPHLWFHHAPYSCLYCTFPVMVAVCDSNRNKLRCTKRYCNVRTRAKVNRRFRVHAFTRSTSWLQSCPVSIEQTLYKSKQSWSCSWSTPMGSFPLLLRAIVAREARSTDPIHRCFSAASSRIFKAVHPIPTDNVDALVSIGRHKSQLVQTQTHASLPARKPIPMSFRYTTIRSSIQVRVSRGHHLEDRFDPLQLRNCATRNTTPWVIPLSFFAFVFLG